MLPPGHLGLASTSDRLVECSSSILEFGASPPHIEATIDEYLQLVSRYFSRGGFFDDANQYLALEAQANQLSILLDKYRALGHLDIEYKIVPQQSAVVRGLHLQLQSDHRTLRSLHRLVCNRSQNLGYIATPLQKLLAWTGNQTGRKGIHVGYAVWNFPFFGYWLKRKIIKLTQPTTEFHSAAPNRDAMCADIYAILGARFESRGQIDLALQMWDRARPPDDVDIDSLTCQAMLKSSKATNASLALQQKAWVRRHLGARPLIPSTPRSSTRRRVRIGYFCSFINSDTMRNMMGNVIAAHDRSRFEIFGYSPQPAPQDIERAFDCWRLVRSNPFGESHNSQSKGFTDEQFAELVRSDEIDVFVELSGFSPGNRFGAMSLRCAPVQVSFMNHTGTSQVPNVDYVLSDEICTPSTADCQAHYSETIYRLPGCFFCFDYSTFSEPDVTDPPFLTSHHITFGCFGTGGKISDEIVGLWGRLLHRVPTSVLHLQNSNLSNADDRRFMMSRFLRHGISSDRLILEGGVDRKTLLQIYGSIDISLDTWPYCGGNTIAESKWHGVPVVTYRGSRFSSAYGASLVSAAGCSDLVAETPDEYVGIAAQLANDPARLIGLRRNLRKLSFDHGLGNSKLFARRLESAYLDMLSRLEPRNHIPTNASELL